MNPIPTPQVMAAHPAVGAIRGEVEAEVLAGRLPAGAGARKILDAFRGR